MKKSLFRTFCFTIILIFIASSFVGCSKSKHGIKNIIIIIGDGMGLEHIEGGELYENKDYDFKNWHQTLVDTDSILIGPTITDSAAGGTAIATGVTTINGYIGVDKEGVQLKTIMDYAKEKDKATAVVSTDNIFEATPAAFSGHSTSRTDRYEIIVSQIETSNVDLLCGATHSLSTDAETQNLATKNGYVYCDNYDNIETTFQADKVYWQFDLEGINARVKLEEVTAHALDFVERDKDGFVMMIEQADIDKYSHNNDIYGVVKSVASLNNTVQVVMDWIGNKTDTLVLITADHETGGLIINDPVVCSNEFSNLNGYTYSYSFSITDHTRTKVGLFVHGAKPDFKSFDFYSSKEIVKNINVNHIMRKYL